MELPKVIDDEYVKENLRETARRFVIADPITEFVNEGLCGKDLRKIDMSNLSIENFRRLTYDSKTIFSDKQIEKFHPSGVIEDGKNFANLENNRKEEKSDNDRPTIAFIDRFSNISNKQFGGKVLAYRVTKNGVEIAKPDSQGMYFKDEGDSEDRGFHGNSVASFAAGKECGVAPNSNVILFDMDEGITFEDAQRAVVEFIISNKDNKQFIMPDILSISADTSTEPLDELKKINCAFINSKIARELYSWGRMDGDGVSLDQFVQDMLDMPFDKNIEYIQEILKEDTIVPVTGRTCSYIDNDGNIVYRYQGSVCGNSFPIGNIAGLFARIREIDKNITQDDFDRIIKNTAIKNDDNNMKYLDEKGVIDKVKERVNENAKNQENDDKGDSETELTDDVVGALANDKDVGLKKEEAKDTVYGLEQTRDNQKDTTQVSLNDE